MISGQASLDANFAANLNALPVVDGGWMLEDARGIVELRDGVTFARRGLATAVLHEDGWGPACSPVDEAAWHDRQAVVHDEIAASHRADAAKLRS